MKALSGDAFDQAYIKEMIKRIRKRQSLQRRGTQHHESAAQRTDDAGRSDIESHLQEASRFRNPRARGKASRWKEESRIA